MKKLIDLTGQKFGRLIVIERRRNLINGRKMWMCLCECGKNHLVMSWDLISGKTVSCGCKKRKHGYEGTGIYSSYTNMVSRCTRKYCIVYDYYGGRGISICERWNNIENFIEDMLPTYKEGLQLDRIDVNGNYCPENCRWVTRKENMRNTRNNRVITYNGKTHCLIEWSEILGINYSTLSQRLKKGWSTDRAFNTK